MNLKTEFYLYFDTGEYLTELSSREQ